MLKATADQLKKQPEIHIVRTVNGFVITAADHVTEDPFHRYRNCYVAENVVRLASIITMLVDDWHEETP